MTKVKKTWLLFMLLFIFLAAACDEPKGAAFVYGKGAINPGGGDDHINGDLSKSSSSDYYGYCKKDSSGFSFEVGHASFNDLGDVNWVQQPLYFKFEGIKGPNGVPTEGVFDLSAEALGTPKSGAEFRGSFTSAKIKADESFIFDSTQGNCAVELFATPSTGEVLDNIDVKNKSFEYYVRISCNGMEDVIGSGGLPLNSLYLEFYFDNC
ncbi:MAG: hypothetical protein JXR91_09790 [Deltaproteobacteria bacterium]|nr:hypothetical protein [Deltaproteobacteria bacterium]